MNRIALILGVCLAGFLQVSAEVPAVKCKDLDTFIQYPNDCSKYYACVEGVAYEQKCPDGYWFNPANKHCDYPSSVDEKYCPKIECKPEGIHYLATHYSCSEYILCYEGTPLTQSCAEGLEFDPKLLQCVLYKDSTCEILNCPEESETPVFLPNKRDCESYYICVKGSAVAQSCAKGLHWNAEDEQCQHPKTAQCEQKKEEIQSAALIPQAAPTTFTIACPLFGIKFLPSPTECEYYFGCNNGKSHLFECPSGTAYDEIKKTCVLRTHVERCSKK